jgi:hypothetical protein
MAEQMNGMKKYQILDGTALNSNPALRPKFRCKHNHHADAPPGASFLRLGDGKIEITVI